MKNSTKDEQSNKYEGGNGVDNIIIFKIKLEKGNGGFAKASNFISKMSKGENLSLQEVFGISALRYNGKNVNYRSIAEYTLQRKEHFKSILKPENLSVSSEYQVYYCLWIENESLKDVVDLQYDCLIKKFFKKDNIFSGYERNLKTLLFYPLSL